MDPRIDPTEIPQPPVPWFTFDAQQRVRWRDGDIVISVPAKSGTTWTMNIVHQLRSGGDRELEDIYVEVPWLEFIPGPDSSSDDVVAHIDAMPAHRRRAFKTHSPPPLLPFIESEAAVKYVVVVRNPEEALVSLKYFIERHRPEWFELWTGSRENTLARARFEDFYNEVAVPNEFPEQLFGFLASWWPLRAHSNVLLLHFANLKRDHEGSIRTIAEFLGFSPADEQWPTILECTSFAWMKAHADKFEARKAAAIPLLQSGAMVRKGEVGGAREDGMTESLAAQLAGRGRAILGDEAAFEWLYRGGPLP